MKKPKPSKKPRPVVLLHTNLSRFLSAFDLTMYHWRTGKIKEAILKSGEAMSARDSINKHIKSAVHKLTPPAKLTAIQFAERIYSDVEDAWHLCRFVHCMNPSVRPTDTADRLLFDQMQKRPCRLHQRLAKDCRSIGFTLELDKKPARSAKHKVKGPPPPTQWEEDTILEEWVRVRRGPSNPHGMDRAEFARFKGLTFKQVEKMKNTSSQRKRRADKAFGHHDSLSDK